MSDPAADNATAATREGRGGLGRFVALNVAGTAVTGAVGFVTSILLARWLGPGDRGLLALLISVSAIVLLLGGIGIPWATIYYSSKRDAGALFGNSLLMAAILAVILVPAAWALRQPLSDAFAHGQGGLEWVLAAALVPIVFLDWTTHGQLQGMLLFGRFNALMVAGKIAEGLLVVVLLGALGMGVAAGLWATAAASAVMVAGALKPIFAAGRPKIDRLLLGAMLRYGSRVQIGSIFQQAIARVDILILQFFRPLPQVGYYVVAQAIAELVLRMTNAFESSVMSLVTRYEGDPRQATTSASALRHHGLLAGVATVANVFFGALVIQFAYGSSYTPAIAPMLVLLPGVWFLGTAGVVRSDLGGRGRPGLASKLAGASAAVVVVADLALIPPLGVIGAALASVIAYTGYGVASLVALRRVSGIPIRSLVVPTRADLAVYRRAFVQATVGRRRRRRSGP